MTVKFTIENETSTCAIHDRPMSFRESYSTLTYVFLAFAATASAQQSNNNDDSGKSAARIYQERCASCHGRDLAGGNAQSMVDGIWQFGGSDWDLVRNIKFGISNLGMPDFRDALSNEEIDQLVRYIRDAQHQRGVERPPIPEVLYTRDYDVRVEKWISEGIETPWALTFLDDETALLTERPGRLRVINGGHLGPQPVHGTPEVLHAGQAGLMDVIIDPNYVENGWIYLSYSHAINRKNDRGEPASMSRVVRGRVQRHRWVEEQVVFQAPQDAYRYSVYNLGCRLLIDSEGHLLFSIGDFGAADESQDLAKPNGKIHRVWPNGSIPDDNPFTKSDSAMPSVYTLGNRNAQGLARHPDTNEIWETEHGPMGGDEVNIIIAGRNYGWPKITYGINYDGQLITDKMAMDGMVQPVLYWVPSIAVCGAEFYQGKEFSRWDNNLFVGALAFEELRRLVVYDQRVIHQELILKNAGRVRDVTCGPDGAIYVVLNNPDVVLRLSKIARRLRQ
jgi:glucose/arabinose dehydrogenase